MRTNSLKHYAATTLLLQVIHLLLLSMSSNVFCSALSAANRTAPLVPLDDVSPEALEVPPDLTSAKAEGFQNPSAC